MKNLIIIGAGGFGRELCAVAKDARGYATEFVVKGFLDDRADALANFRDYPPVLGSLASYQFEADDIFITALGNIEARKKCVAEVKARGGKFATIIHRSAWMGPHVTIGEGSFISNNVVLTADISVGEHVCIFQNVSIGHDSTLANFSHVYAQCALGGGVSVGEGAAIYPGSQIVPRRTIGARAVVGIGSTVLVNVADATTVFGQPAKPLAKLD